MKAIVLHWPAAHLACNFRTAKKTTWHTDARPCHVDAAVCDSDWEMELCRLLESHPNVLSYVANQGLGFTVPYRMGGESRAYVRTSSCAWTTATARTTR